MRRGRGRRKEGRVSVRCDSGSTQGALREAMQGLRRRGLKGAELTSP